MLFSPQILARRYKQIVAPSWTPASMSNLVAWYKADTGVTTNTGNVTAVVDQSGNGFNLVNNGTVPLTASSAYNSLPAFGFVAANDAALYVPYTGVNPSVVLSPTNRLTVFVIGRMNTNTVTGGRLISIGQGGNPDYAAAGNIAALLRQGSSNGIESYYNGAATVVDDAISLATNYRLGLIADASNLTHYINGAGVNAQPITLNLTSPTNIVIGNQWAGSGSTPPASTVYQGAAWEGPILEIVIAMSATAGDAASFETYAVARVGA